MNTSFWKPYISDGTMQAICWTLIHSLWIGLVIALLCGVIIAFTRKSAAALRYRLLCGLLVVFVLAVGVTYYIEINSAAAMAEAVKGKIERMAIKGQHNVFINNVITPQNQSLLGSLQTFLNQNAKIIFMVWLLFFVLKSLKMTSGLLYIQRIKNYKTHPVTDDLKHQIKLFTHQIGIRRVVRLMQSELVKVPVAVGWLKPMILLPMGIALQLTPDQLDGILWHELAHIRRHDYLVNILQGVVETVFFFNPGMLWLSSLIRAEREACCDDMVLSRLNRKANYLEALLSFGHGEFNQARYAMSIGGGNQLRDRLKRMINQENKRLSVAEKSALAVGLMLLTAFTTISKNNPIVKNLTVKFTNKAGKVISKTFPVTMNRLPEAQRANDYKPGNREKRTIVIVDSSIRFISVLFKNSDADPANNDIRAMDENGNKYHLIVSGGKIIAMEVNGDKIAESKLPENQFIYRNILAVLAEKRRERENGFTLVRAYRKDTTGKIWSKRGADSTKWSKTPMFKTAIKPVPYAAKFANMRARFREDSLSYIGDQRRVNDVIADLVARKIVPNADAVKWFGLSDTEFIVNGQKQSNELQQVFKEKYGVHEGYGLYYGPVEMTGRGVFIGSTSRRVGEEPSKQPKPKFGRIMPKSNDSILWERNQLIQQQQDFATKEFIANKAKMFKQDGKYYGKAQTFGYYKGPRIPLQTIVANITDELVTDNILKDKNDLNWFNLTNTALIVNGKKQTEEAHQRLKDKYLRAGQYPMDDTDNPNFGLHYNPKTGGMGIGITIGGLDN